MKLHLKICSLFLVFLTFFSAMTLPAFASDGVVVDGKRVELPAGGVLDLRRFVSEGAQFAFASVTEPGGKSYETVQPVVTLSAGASVAIAEVSLCSVSSPTVRAKDPEGIRFETVVGSSDFASLTGHSAVASVSLATLIAPTEYVTRSGAFTPEALKKEYGDGVVSYVTVNASANAWYDGTTVDGGSVFAGSLVRIREANYNRSFSGIGMLELTLKNGERTVLYADGGSNSVHGTMSGLCKELLSSEGAAGLAEEQKEMLKKYADAYVQSNREKQVKALKGLNVLAIGDSLFGGDYLGREGQWLNLMAKECEWNLTNLGTDGWTVAYNPDAYPAGQRVRDSIYQKLYNDGNYRFGNAAYTFNYSGKNAKAPGDVDVIFLEGGINDYGWGIPLGEVNSSDPSTCLGAYNKIISRLLETYPNATIILVTTWQLDGKAKEYTTGLNRLYEAKYKSNDRVRLIDAGDKKVSGVDMNDAEFRRVYGKTDAPNDRYHLGSKGMELMHENLLSYVWEATRSGWTPFV